MKNMDLHIHSEHSVDGEFTVQEIIRISKEQGLDTISITDHNSVKGITTALNYGKELNITVIPGIEIDCVYQGVNLHVLGYYMDWQGKDFADLEKYIATQEMSAFPKMLHNLAAAGITADAAEILHYAAGKIPCGELIGEVVLNKENAQENPLLTPYLAGGARSNMPYLNFYRDFFAQGKVAHVPLQYFQLQEMIQLIKNNNGIPILAHPGDNLKNNMNLLAGIINAGVMGIEVFSNYHTPAQTEFFYEQAKAQRLFITRGSDFHGKNKPGITIGGCSCPAGFEPLALPLRQ